MYVSENLKDVSVKSKITQINFKKGKDMYDYLQLAVLEWVCVE